MASHLARYGCRDAEIMAALHPWDRLGFLWQERRLTVRGIAQILSKAGLSLDASPESLAAVEGKLANPLHNFGDGFLPFSLLGARSVYSPLRDVGFEPPHHELFAGLCASVGEPVEDAQQSCDRDECLMPTGEVLSGVPVYASDGAHWIVRYRHGDENHSFACQAKGTWMDVPSVMAAFDRQMARLGAPRRLSCSSPAGERTGSMEPSWPLTETVSPRLRPSWGSPCNTTLRASSEDFADPVLLALEVRRAGRPATLWGLIPSRQKARRRQSRDGPSPRTSDGQARY